MCGLVRHSRLHCLPVDLQRSTLRSVWTIDLELIESWLMSLDEDTYDQVIAQLKAKHTETEGK